MNILYLGLGKEIQLPKGGYLIIDDELRHIPRSRVFEPLKHRLNPLKKISYKEARQIADIVYTVYVQGENTLTVRNGKRVLLTELLSGKERLNRIRGDEEVRSTIQDLLASPVLHRMLCNPTNFSFNPRSKIQARISRSELGDFDALVIGLFLMAHYKGQIIIPDGGFYLRDCHMSLIREQRLIAGINFLGELSPKLRNNVLLFQEKIASGTTMADAETLAQYARLIPGTNIYNEFIEEAVS